MLTVLQALILGLVQGFTELFPISSLGHSVILPSLLGWHINQSSDYFLPFLVATHLATALVLLGFFWRDWVNIVRGLIRSFLARQIAKDDTYARLGWLIVAATVPAGILGLLLQDPLKKLFASAHIAAAALIVNGCVLLLAEHLRTRQNRRTVGGGDQALGQLSWRTAVAIGSVQAGALIPGISRSGSSMAGGLLAGLTNEQAARFSFLLATPLIAAAAVLKLPDLLAPSASSVMLPTIVGTASAAIAAYLSVRFLVKYFESRTLTPYGFYCVAAGIIASLILWLR